MGSSDSALFLVSVTRDVTRLPGSMDFVSEERRLRADLVKWIEIECCKVRVIEQALKQRIDERLEVMRQLREHRRQLPL